MIEQKILVFDVETTGFSPVKDKLLEFGYRMIYPDGEVEQKSILLKRSYIPKNIQVITGITPEMVAADGVPEEELFAHLQELITPDVLLVAHNITFDLPFVNVFFQKYDPNHQILQNDFIDTLTLARAFCPYPHKLGDVCAHLGIKLDNAHRALNDVIATWQVFDTLNNEFEIEQYRNVIINNPKYGKPSQAYMNDKVQYRAR